MNVKKRSPRYPVTISKQRSCEIKPVSPRYLREMFTEERGCMFELSSGFRAHKHSYIMLPNLGS